MQAMFESVAAKPSGGSTLPLEEQAGFRGGLPASELSSRVCQATD